MGFFKYKTSLEQDKFTKKKQKKSYMRKSQ